MSLDCHSGGRGDVLRMVVKSAPRPHIYWEDICAGARGMALYASRSSQLLNVAVYASTDSLGLRKRLRKAACWMGTSGGSHLGWNTVMARWRNSTPLFWWFAVYAFINVDADSVKQIRRLLYRCSLLNWFAGVVVGARDFVAGLYRPPQSESPRMAVTLLYHRMKDSVGLLAKMGKRVVEGALSARTLRWSRREASATVVCAAMDAVREVIRALFWRSNAS